MKKKETEGRDAAASYTALSKEILNSLLDRADAGFQVDGAALYDSYKDRFSQGAADAAENAYGLAARYTGGYGSSYGAQAARAAYQDYMQGLDDAVTAAEERQYQRRKAENDNLFTLLRTVDSLEQKEYDRGRDAVSDREKALADAYNAAKIGDYAPLEAQGIDTAALRQSDAWEAAQARAAYGDYAGLEALGVDLTRNAYERRLADALVAAQYGDNSALNSLGISTDAQERSAALETALRLAEIGDTSALRRLGVNTQRLQYETALSDAVRLAGYGDYAPLEALGADMTAQRSRDALTLAQQAAQYGDYSGL